MNDKPTRMIRPSVFDLRIALVPDDPVSESRWRGCDPVSLYEGALEMLVADMDEGPTPLTAELVERMDWDPWESWASARSLTEVLESPDEVNVLDVGDAELIHLYSDRPYLASLIGVIDQHVAEIGERGALVSMPSRHGVLVHPLHDPSGRAALGAMVPLTRSVYQQGPGSVSPHVYWWREGAIDWIPTSMSREGVDCYPSTELAELLDAA